MEKKVSCKHDIIEDRWKDLLEHRNSDQNSKHRMSSRKKRYRCKQCWRNFGRLDLGELAEIIFSNPHEKGLPKMRPKHAANKTLKTKKIMAKHWPIVWQRVWPA